MSVKGLVTVVLPIYKVEKYLDQCVESVVNQTYKNLEILLIDDGSPDKCPEICDKWAEKDNRIKVIHKENQGLGMARNTGIENANGEYICFFDSDDFIAPETVEKSFLLAEKENAQIVVFGFQTVDGEGNMVSCFVPGVGNRVYRGDEVLDDFFPDFIAPNPKVREPRPFYMSACFMLYKTKTIKDAGWHFVSERKIISEDVYSLLSLFKHIDCVASLPESFYRYRCNESSLSRSYVAGRYEKVKYFYVECVRLCENLGYSEEVLHRVSKPYVAFTISALKQECTAPKSFKEKMSIIKSIINDNIFQQVLKKNKKDIVSTTRRILFFCARNKLYLLAYALLKLKS